MTLSPMTEDGLVTLSITFNPVIVFYVLAAAVCFAVGYLLWDAKEFR